MVHRYGQLLLAKVVGFLLIVAVAYFSREAVRRRYVRPVVHALSVKEEDAARSPRSPRRRPRRSARTGGWCAGCARRSASSSPSGSSCSRWPRCWSAQAPARSTYIKPVDKTVALASGGKAEVEMTPAKVGQNTLTVKVFDPSGKQVDARAVTATEALPSDQYGPLDIQMRKTGAGQYSSSSVSLTKTGSWELVVRVQMSEFDRDVVQVDVEVT